MPRLGLGSGLSLGFRVRIDLMCTYTIAQPFSFGIAPSSVSMRKYRGPRPSEFSALVTAATAHAMSQGPRMHSSLRHWCNTGESETKKSEQCQGFPLVCASTSLSRWRWSASMLHRCLCLVVGGLRCGRRRVGLRWRE